MTRASGVGAGAANGACGAVRGTTESPLPPQPASAITLTNEAKRRMRPSCCRGTANPFATHPEWHVDGTKARRYCSKMLSAVIGVYAGTGLRTERNKPFGPKTSTSDREGPG